eukprot:COSAG05_NODE_898_length_6685_cov_4.419223_7_plen_80_part_00
MIDKIVVYHGTCAKASGYTVIAGLAPAPALSYDSIFFLELAVIARGVAAVQEIDRILQCSLTKEVPYAFCKHKICESQF